MEKLFKDSNHIYDLEIIYNLRWFSCSVKVWSSPETLVRVVPLFDMNEEDKAVKDRSVFSG